LSDALNSLREDVAQMTPYFPDALKGRLPMLDTDGALEVLRAAGNLIEVHECHTFIGYRKRADGSMVEVKIEILDAGTRSGQGRYHVTAKSEDGVEDTASPHDSLEAAIGLVNWRTF
jgi:hypothetical protein